VSDNGAGSGAPGGEPGEGTGLGNQFAGSGRGPRAHPAQATSALACKMSRASVTSQLDAMERAFFVTSLASRTTRHHLATHSGGDHRTPSMRLGSSRLSHNDPIDDSGASRGPWPDRIRASMGKGNPPAPSASRCSGLEET
jgi:hypothetical protein